MLRLFSSPQTLWLALALTACSSKIETPRVGPGFRTTETSEDASSSRAPGDDRDAGQLPEPSQVLIEPEADVASPAAENVPACALHRQEATLEKLHLFFLLDHSGSMGDGDNGRREQKWDPVTLALEAFFADPASRGLQASLTLFPPNINQGTGPADPLLNEGSVCDATSYVEPTVAMTNLPDHEANFERAIASVTPPNEWATPTEPALAGLILQAEALLEQDENVHVAMVLVTDGAPTFCVGGNSVAGTTALAEAVSKRLPTYVVGVGDGLRNLNRVAEGGNTDEAFVVPIRDPRSTERAMLDVFDEIRRQLVSCEAPIPEPPEGRAFDRDKVGVEIARADDSTVSLDYSEDCADGEGWRYDDPASPRAVRLCEAGCATLREQEASVLNIVFTCEARRATAR